ncbi:MAG: adenosylhomocysteinase [Firmicutes bacterium]|nr:adenosylhomocysteinase [Bacillota bacterium]MCL5038364.1 adenosylhomocysteinase [Bacillota bacterium]
MTEEQNLREKGQRRIEWAKSRMPVLSSIAQRWRSETPLQGIRIAACLHVTTETANLVLTLKDGGAEVVLTASNPLSTQDDVVAALNQVYGVKTYARRGVDSQTYYGHIRHALEMQPQITMDDGADLVNLLHSERRDLIPGVLAGTEETTTGVIRLKAMEKDGVLAYPIIAVNDALTKHMFDNRYGTGQSTIDGILRATNQLIAGSVFVVAGYGWCGRGVAQRARGMGANVIVVETDPLRALEAVMDGYRVTAMPEAAREGDIFVTVTGNINVIDRQHLLLMKDGAILANAGHFNVEINIKALAEMASSRQTVRENVEEFRLGDGQRLYVIGEGRLVNLAAAEGHPAHVMDMSFANQALTCEWLIRGKPSLEKKVYPVPAEIDALVARLKLESMGIKLQELTPEQKDYLASYSLGTE